MKLLWVMITEDLKLHENTVHITKKACSRHGYWKDFKKNHGASWETLVDVYNKQIRSILEYAAVVWNFCLMKEEITKMEMV